MKSLFRFLGVVAVLAAVPQFASADVIVEFTTTEGVSQGDTNVTGNANLTSFSTAGNVYTDFIGVGIVDPANAAERLFATATSDPATSTAAVSDLNLATGVLNANTTYDFSAVTPDDSIFVFGNGNGGVSDPIGGSGGTTPPGGTENILEFFAADGTTLVGSISNDVFFQDPGTNAVRAPNLASFDLTRTRPAGGTLVGRTISGFVFDVADINLETGFTVADLGNLQLNSGTRSTSKTSVSHRLSRRLVFPNLRQQSFLLVGWAPSLSAADASKTLAQCWSEQIHSSIIKAS